MGVLEPRVNLYGSDGFAVFTPAVMSKPAGDLYLTLRALDSNHGDPDSRHQPTGLDDLARRI